MAPPPPLGYPWPYAPPAAQDHSPPPQQQHFAPPPQPPYPAYPSSGLPEAAPEPEKAVEIDVDVANQVPEVSTVRRLIPPPPSALPPTAFLPVSAHRQRLRNHMLSRPWFLWWQAPPQPATKTADGYVITPRGGVYSPEAFESRAGSPR